MAAAARLPVRAAAARTAQASSRPLSSVSGHARRDRSARRLRAARARWRWFDHAARAYTAVQRGPRRPARGGDHLLRLPVVLSVAGARRLPSSATSAAASRTRRRRSPTAVEERLPEPHRAGARADQHPGRHRRQGGRRDHRPGRAALRRAWAGSTRCVTACAGCSAPATSRSVRARRSSSTSSCCSCSGLALLASLVRDHPGHRRHAASPSDTVGPGRLAGRDVLLKVVSVALALPCDTCCSRSCSPGCPAPTSPGARCASGALLGAVGFEVLKVAARSSSSAPPRTRSMPRSAWSSGLLIWINLVARLLMYVAAWTATEQRSAQPAGYDSVPVRRSDAGRMRGRRAAPSPCAARSSVRRWGPGWPESSPGAAPRLRHQAGHRGPLPPAPPAQQHPRAQQRQHAGPAGRRDEPPGRAAAAGRAGRRGGACVRRWAGHAAAGRTLGAGSGWWRPGCRPGGPAPGWEAPAQQRGRLRARSRRSCAAPSRPGCGRRGWPRRRTCRAPWSSSRS